MNPIELLPLEGSSQRPMPAFLDLLLAEIMKLKRSLILGLALLFPLGLLTVAILVGLVVIKPEDHATWRNWMAFTLVPWSGFLLPMLVCLLSTLLLNLEHQNHQWKHLHAMPVRRWKFLGAKQAILALLLLFSHALLFLGFWGGGWLLRLIRPGILLGTPDAGMVASLLGFLFLASWAVTSAHIWLAARFLNLAVNLGVGLAGAMLIVVVTQRPAMARAFPWAIPGRMLSRWMGDAEAGSMGLIAFLSVSIGTALFALACWDAQHRESEG